MFEWNVKYSESSRERTRLSFSMGSLVVYADTEEEARKIIKEDEPDLNIDSIERGEELNDD